MKRHAPIGADILAVIDFPYPVAPIVRHHHENWDGSGYPDRIAGAVIPIGSRILAVVDCFDALTSDRPYRPRMPDREALDVLRQPQGDHVRPARSWTRSSPCTRLNRTGCRRAQTAPAPRNRPARRHPGVAQRAIEPGSRHVLRARAARSERGVLDAANRRTRWHARLRGHPAARGAGVVRLRFRQRRHRRRMGSRRRRLWRTARYAHSRGGTTERMGCGNGQSRCCNSDARLDLDEQARERSPFRSTLAVRIVPMAIACSACWPHTRAEPNAFDDRRIGDSLQAARRRPGRHRAGSRLVRSGLVGLTSRRSAAPTLSRPGTRCSVQAHDRLRRSAATTCRRSSRARVPIWIADALNACTPTTRTHRANSQQVTRLTTITPTASADGVRLAPLSRATRLSSSTALRRVLVMSRHQ